jgi:hypothetical protein
MGEQLTVRCGLEQMAVFFQPGLDDVSVDYVTVVRESEGPSLAADAEWLDVLPSAHGGGRVTDMAYASMTGESGEGFFREDVPHQAGTLADSDLLVRAEDSQSASLLATVLEGPKAYEGPLRGLLHPVQSQHTALLVQFIQAEPLFVHDLIKVPV